MSSPLSRAEKWIARTLFENRLLKANDKAFQSLFWALMRAKHGRDFVEVRPQGRRGDGGNDGYLPATGHYFQVYGPTDPKDKITKAAKKLTSDFKTILKEWGGTKPIQAYSFVFNDKYEGTFRDIAQALGAIEQSHDIPCRPLTAADLEDVFIELDADAMERVLGALIPDSKIGRIQYDVLKYVVDYILDSPSASVPSRLGELPDIDEKVRLNGLAAPWADIVRGGARQVGHVELFFSKNSRFVRQELRDHMVEQYRQAVEWVREQKAVHHAVDAVFAEFRGRLLPKDAVVAAAHAVDILIAYYFEACDVFDPFADSEAANASPR